MPKRLRWLVYLVPVIAVLGSLYAFMSAPFRPADNSAPPAVVRKFPLPSTPDWVDSGDATDSTISASDSSDESENGGDSPWVKKTIAEFYSRHDSATDEMSLYLHESNRREFFDIGYSVLRDEESPDTFIRLLRDPEESVRIAAMKSFGEAMNALGVEGTGAMLNVWRKLDEKQTDAVMAAACETLIQETREGEGSFMPSVLFYLGDPGHEALPLLAWVSNHHPGGNMRVYAFNTAAMMDPNSPIVRDLRSQRFIDPSGSVRLVMLQESALQTVATILGVQRTERRTATSEPTSEETSQATPKAMPGVEG